MTFPPTEMQKQRLLRAINRLKDIVRTVESGYPYFGVPQAIKYAIKAMENIYYDK